MIKYDFVKIYKKKLLDYCCNKKKKKNYCWKIQQCYASSFMWEDSQEQ